MKPDLQRLAVLLGEADVLLRRIVSTAEGTDIAPAVEHVRGQLESYARAYRLVRPAEKSATSQPP